MTLAPEATVGRDRELALLDELLDQLPSSPMTCLAVQGDPGIGKTRLLRELRARAEARGHVTLAGSSAEFERDLPFGVWEDALDAHVAALDRAEWDPGLSPRLASVLPSLGAADGTASQLADERYRLHRAMRSLLGVLAADRPLVLVLDDLHWSDEASIELISSVLHRGVDAPVLLALGFRSGRVPPGLNSALALPVVRILDLAPLDDDDALVLAGEGLDARRRLQILAESGGNPFYIEQLARARPAVDERPATTGPDGVPQTVAAALRNELGGLEPQVRLLLEAAAVAGDPFDPEHAAEIAELDPGAGLDALDVLLEERFVRATDVPRRFAFRHPLVRRAVYESSRAGWRLRAHGRAAAALASRGGSAAGRAHHVEQSASRGDAEAIAVLLAAADETAARAPAVAARWFEAALRLMPDADRPARIGTLVQLATALRYTGDLAGCRARLLEAIDLLPAEDAAMRVALTAGAAATETFMGRHGDAQRRLGSALADLPDRRSPEGVLVLLTLAGEAFFTTEIEKMWLLSNEALALARDLGDEALTLSALCMVAHAGGMHGEQEAAERARAEADARISNLTDDELAVKFEDLNRLGWAEFYMGRWDPAIEHFARGIDVARRVGRGEFLPLMTQAQGLSEMFRGNLARAAELHDRSLESARLAANPHMTAAALVTTSQIASLRGDVDAALRAAEEAVQLAAASDEGIVPALGAVVLARALLETDAATARVEEVIVRAGGWELPLLPTFWQAKYQEAKAHADASAGRLDEADQAAARATAAGSASGVPVVVAYGLRARAAVALGRGSLDEAVSLGLAAAEEAERGGARIEAAAGRLLAGRAQAAAGARDEAVATLRGAETALDGCGALRLRDEARRELRKLGARSERRGASGATGEDGVASLTKRELEIAELVMDRRTNREIAATLFLSDKTIESHLRNIFVKLGVSSRVEVARAVERARRAP